jgi:hypothetical protein
MKKLILALLLIVLSMSITFNVYAADNFKSANSQDETREEKNRICFAVGGAYEIAANIRNEGYNPQTAFNYVREADKPSKNGKTILLDSKVKSIVNQVYFDVGFINAYGTALRQQMYLTCMGYYKPMQPLK